MGCLDSLDQAGARHWAGLNRLYFRPLDTLVKVVLNCVPTPATTAMMATAIAAAIKPCPAGSWRG
jgi:hypothetical protein